MAESTITYLVLLGAVVLFMSNRVPVALVAIGGYMIWQQIQGNADRGPATGPYGSAPGPTYPQPPVPPVPPAPPTPLRTRPWEGEATPSVIVTPPPVTVLVGATIVLNVKNSAVACSARTSITSASTLSALAMRTALTRRSRLKALDRWAILSVPELKGDKPGGLFLIGITSRRRARANGELAVDARQGWGA